MKKKYKLMFYILFVFVTAKYVYLSPVVVIHFYGSGNLFEVSSATSVEGEEPTDEEVDEGTHWIRKLEGGESDTIKMHVISRDNDTLYAAWYAINPNPPFNNLDNKDDKYGDSISIRRDEMDSCKINIYTNTEGKIQRIEKSFGLCIKDIRCIFSNCKKQ